MVKKIIIIACLLISPGLVLAEGKWKVEEKINTIKASGDCEESRVRIDLFQSSQKDPIYTSGAICENKRFNFSDNLLQWESLPDGEYDLVLNGDRDGAKKVEIARPLEVGSLDGVEVSDGKEKIIESEDNQEATFLEAFVDLQRAIFEMREKLESETGYSEVTKSGIGLVLDGMDVAAGKITNLVFSPEEAVEGEIIIDENSGNNQTETESTIGEVVENENVPLEETENIGEAVVEEKENLLDSDIRVDEFEQDTSEEEGSDQVVSEENEEQILLEESALEFDVSLKNDTK